MHIPKNMEVKEREETKETKVKGSCNSCKDFLSTNHIIWEQIIIFGVGWGWGWGWGWDNCFHFWELHEMNIPARHVDASLWLIHKTGVFSVRTYYCAFLGRSHGSFHRTIFGG